jgi:molecular chaperone GrpE (heat shock protein)
MLDVKKIFVHVCDCIESVYEQTCDDDEIRKEAGSELEKGLKLIHNAFLDSLSKYDNSKMDFWKFVNLNRNCLFFEHESDKQDKLLIQWGEFFGGESNYYLAIYPVFKMLYDQYKKGA